MSKHIFLIHGRGFKPGKKVLYRQWMDAMRHGIVSDFGEETGVLLDGVRLTPVYFGNLSADFLESTGRTYSRKNDIADRKITVAGLKAYGRQSFKKPRAKKIYNALPGKSSVQEFLADTFGTVGSYLGVSTGLISHFAPDVKEYWNHDSGLGSMIRSTLTNPLARAMQEGDDILLIAHSLGAIVSYDVLWKFSHYGEYRNLQSKGGKVSLWITLGSPLGDETVKRHLKGALAGGYRRYPDNIRRWVNVAAEDDYICYDQDVRNDYQKMCKWGMIDSIKDKRIFNLAVRRGKSNPHHSTGYLIHPAVSKSVAGWLGVDQFI